MNFSVEERTGGSTDADLAVDSLIIAGWTGRDPDKVEHHIQELEAIGVARPASIPAFYRVGANLVTTADRVDVLGATSSGEVEFMLLATHDGLLVGVGSDHTDRELEASSVARSKQICPKPVSRRLWRLADVQDHWDALVLSAYATNGVTRRRYQSGSVAGMLAPDRLLRKFGPSGRLPTGTAMLCGTLPVEGDIAPADRFEVELHDPVLGRTLRHAYTCRVLPIVN